MKINKKLSTAIVLSLMLGVYGTASADDIYAIDGGIINSRSGAAPSNNELKLNVLPGWANSSSSVYGGYASSTKGNSTNNNGTINGVTVGTFYGGYAEKGSAKSNIANVLGGTVNSYVFGGYTVNGTAESNKATISGGEIGESVYGSYTQIGDATNNEVVVNNAKVNFVVTGAYAETGAVSSNNVEINSSTVRLSAQGGASNISDANGNSLTITNSKIKNVYGGWAQGGSGKGNAESNEVTINSGEIGQNVYGGYAEKGNAQSNIAKVLDGTVGGDVYGGLSFGGTATDNAVRVNGGSVNDLIGGLAYKGDANTNSVYIGAEIDVAPGDVTSDKLTINNIYGGKAGDPDDTSGNPHNANGNTVTIRDTWYKIDTGSSDHSYGLIPKIKENVYGGHTENGNAQSNKVTISGGEIVGNVYGGNTAHGAADGNKVGISTNAATNFTAANVYGGNGTTGAADNEVWLGAGANVTGEVYGGYVNNYYETCNVANNKVNITSGTIGSKVYGAKTAKGAATENEVVVTDSSISGGVYGGYSDDNSTAESNTVTISNSSVSGEIRGGNSYSGIAKSNQVSITDGTIGGFDASGNPTSSFSYVYGNYSESGSAIGGGVTNVTITDSKINGLVLGGYHYKTNSKGLTVEGNKVEISDSTVSRTVYGGLANSGDAKGNQVSISQTKENATEMGNGVYGNYAQNGSAIGGEVTNVTVNGGTIRGDVTGGWGKTGATGNSVSITGGNLTENVYGGQSTEGNATENKVEISGGTIKDRVYGGKTESGAANNNKVGTAENVAANFTSASIYGGRATTGAEGNEVHIGEGADVKGFVYGGYSDDGLVENNLVCINGSSEKKVKVDSFVYGGDTLGASKGNKVGSEDLAATNFTADYVYGGRGESKASENKIYLGEGVAVSKEAYGGRTSGTAEQNIALVTDTAEIKTLYGGRGITAANKNEVTLLGGTITGAVYGGKADTTATDNIVNISGSAKLDTADVYGGQGTTSTGNTLNIDTWEGTKTMKSISDFQAINVVDTQGITVGDADGLEDGKVVLDINDSTVDLKALANDAKIVYLTSTGSDDFSAKFSSAKFNGYKPNEGIWRSADKGFGIEGSDAEFQIDEKEAFVSVKEVVLAGYFTGNTGATQYNSAVINDEGGFVLTSGVEAYEKIYGSFDATGICSAGDKVFIESALDMSKSTIYGNNDKADGNVLKVKANGVKVKGIENFENINFYIPADAAAGDKMLTVGTDIDLTNINVAAGFHNDTTLGYGDKVILIDAPSVTGLDGVSEVKVDDTDFTTYDVMVYQGDASMEQVESGATTLVAEMANTELKENSKILAETIIAGATVVNDGSDMLAGAGFDSAASAIAADLETGAPSGKMSMFGAISGNKSKVHTGSHVDVKGWNMNLGFAKELKNKDGKMIIGPVVEYGRGDYDSYLDNGYHGEGNSHYVGGGVMAKQINNNGNYFEGSLRAGKLTNEFKSTGGSYDSDVTYLAGHLGLGHVQKMDAKNSMDYYAKYFHTHTDGDDIKVNAKNKDLDMKADSLTSARLRIGTRLNHKMSEKSSYYIGFAWQREFSGIANAALAGKEIAAPSMKGNSGFMELGVKLFDSSRYDLDLGGFGSVGKKEGAGFNFNFNFKF